MPTCPNCDVTYLEGERHVCSTQSPTTDANEKPEPISMRARIRVGIVGMLFLLTGVLAALIATKPLWILLICIPVGIAFLWAAYTGRELVW
jgi:hypothetical protein